MGCLVSVPLALFLLTTAFFAAVFDVLDGMHGDRNSVLDVPAVWPILRPLVQERMSKHSFERTMLSEMLMAIMSIVENFDQLFVEDTLTVLLRNDSLFECMRGVEEARSLLATLFFPFCRKLEVLSGELAYCFLLFLVLRVQRDGHVASAKQEVEK